jgi:hypothetical protein
MAPLENKLHDDDDDDDDDDGGDDIPRHTKVQSMSDRRHSGFIKFCLVLSDPPNTILRPILSPCTTGSSSS